MKLIALSLVILSLSILNPYHVNAQNLECGRTIDGTIADGQFNVETLTFNNQQIQNVTFTNCLSTFDTQMRIKDGSNNDITSSSKNNCDGDDCADPIAPCTHSENRLREAFTMVYLTPGTYTIEINPYNAGGTYEIETICETTPGSLPTPSPTRSPTRSPTPSPTPSPAPSPIDDVSSIACGETVEGSLDTGRENIATFTFNNQQTQTVIFTNCQSTFDTQMRIKDGSNNDITSSSENLCGGDDCIDPNAPCTHSENRLREAFTMKDLTPGTYTIEINPYNAGGAYRIEAICGTPPTPSPTRSPTPAPVPSPIPSPTSSPIDNSGSVDCCAKRCRKEWSTLTQAERNLYIEGFRQLAATDSRITQQMAQAHNDLFNQGIHNGPLFLPWHRAYIHDLESKIRGLGGDYACFGLPYWDWTNEPTRSEVSNGAIVTILNSGLGNDPMGQCVTGTFGSQTFEQYTPSDNACLRRNVQYQSNTRCGEVSAAEVMDEIDATNEYSVFRRSFEWIPHSYPHICIGEDMASGNSPDDPIFYLHHNMVDYAWALWQDCNDYDQGTTTSNSNRYIGELTDVLSLPYNTNNPNEYTVNDVIDITDLNVIYEKGPFWDNANVDGSGNCGPDSNPNNINDAWFYSDSRRRRTRRRLTESQTKSQEIYDELVESGEYDNHSDLVHAWNVALCEWKQMKDDGEICEIPEEFDDCSDMEINPDTNDIDITLDEILSKEGLNDCMIQQRIGMWDWAVLSNTKLGLCSGCYDRFCDKTSLKDKCQNVNQRDDDSSPSNNNNNNNNAGGIAGGIEPISDDNYYNDDDRYYVLNVSTQSAIFWLLGILLMVNIICFAIYFWSKYGLNKKDYSKVIQYDSEVTDA